MLIYRGSVNSECTEYAIALKVCTAMREKSRHDLLFQEPRETQIKLFPPWAEHEWPYYGNPLDPSFSLRERPCSKQKRARVHSVERSVI